MKKQSKAKEEQGYVISPCCCDNCANLEFGMELPAWMHERNLEALRVGDPPYYGEDRKVRKCHLRCAVGGFAVKKTAFCDCYFSMETA